VTFSCCIYSPSNKTKSNLCHQTTLAQTILDETTIKNIKKLCVDIYNTTPVMSHIHAFIEIEKGSNLKYEFNKQTKRLELDRMLPQPYVYPFSYGFIPNTLAEDGDELDILIVSDKVMPNNHTMTAYIIGALLMEDEHGHDNKILAVCDNDYFYGNTRDITDLSSDILESIQTFFANYKINEPDKWSRVYGFVNSVAAHQIYNRSVQAHSKQVLDENNETTFCVNAAY